MSSENTADEYPLLKVDWEGLVWSDFSLEISNSIIVICSYDV
jgi:hypothetical protein